MDHINKKLTSDSINHTKYEVSIRASLNLTKKTLNRYYNMTDSSEVYRIAMGMFLILVLYMFYRYLFYCNIVLHPRHKLSYFKQAGWPTEWINTAEDIVRTKFNRSYAVNNDTEDENDDEDIVVMVRSSMLFFFHPRSSIFTPL